MLICAYYQLRSAKLMSIGLQKIRCCTLNLKAFKPLQTWWIPQFVNVPNRGIWAQQASSTRLYSRERNTYMCISIYSWYAVLCVVFAVMCISVIYKFLISGLWSAESPGQAKPSLQGGKQSKVSQVKSHSGWSDSVCFERGASMDSFAAVLTMLRSSSMYKLSVTNQER